MVYKLSKINKKQIGKKGIERILQGAFRYNFEIRDTFLKKRKLFRVLKEQVDRKKMAQRLLKIENKLALKYKTGEYYFQAWKNWVVETDDIRKYKDRLSLAQA